MSESSISEKKTAAIDKPKGTGTKKGRRIVNQVEVDDEESVGTSDEEGLNTLRVIQEQQAVKKGPLYYCHSDSEGYEVLMTLDGKEVKMQLDTGAGVSVMGSDQFKKLFGAKAYRNLEPSKLRLLTYTKEVIQPAGLQMVSVQYGRTRKKLPLHVVPTGGPPLLGREWLRSIRLEWSLFRLMSKDDSTAVDEVLSRHPDVFSDELGQLRGIQAHIAVREGSHPKHLKPRSVPYARRAAVEKELVRLEKQGIVKVVAHSDWATPIVAPPKSDGAVRVCGDFKVTVNPVLDIDDYPLPKIEEIFANLNGGTTFSVLDLIKEWVFTNGTGRRI